MSLGSRNTESAIVHAPADAVFAAVETLNFKWSRIVSQAGHDAETDTINLCYTDGTIQTIQRVEFSKLDRSVSWEVISSEPAASAMSQIHTIRCHRVTADDSTFVQWTTDFSSDVTPAIIEDCKWKKKDAFEDIEAFVAPASGLAGTKRRAEEKE